MTENHKGYNMEILKRIGSLGIAVARGAVSGALDASARSGTPIQNDMNELWCLLHFIDSTAFSDYENFLHPLIFFYWY